MAAQEHFVGRPLAGVGVGLALAFLWGSGAASTETGEASAAHLAALRSELHNSESPYVFVVAHRGCWRATSENSLSGIKACIRAGVDMVELDVREASGGRLVLMHDATLDRTTNGSGPLAETTLQELRRLRLKSAAGGPETGRLTDDRVPTLREALRAAKDRIMINIDAKETLHDRIFQEVEDVGITDQVLIKMRSAPDDPALAKASFHGRALFMPVIVACGSAVAGNGFCVPSLARGLPRYDRYDPVAYELIYSTPGFLNEGADALRQRGRIWVNTLKPEYAGGLSDETAVATPDKVWGHLLESGVTMIQTDYPIELLDYLQKQGRRGDVHGPASAVHGGHHEEE